MNRSLLVLALLIFAGCSGGSEKKFDDSMKPALLDFAQFLEAIPGDGIKPPKKMSEFIPLEPMAPVAAEHLQSGKLVYIWGAGLVKGGSKVIAYEKAVESAGGWVLLEDGTVKEMTSEQFAAAPKAGK